MQRRKFRADETDAAQIYFNDHGYVVFSDIIPPDVRSTFWEDVEQNIRLNPNLQFTNYGKQYKQVDLSDELRTKLPRIIDIQGHSPMSIHLMLCEPISRFLKALYRTEATCLQTLTYKYSSEQGAHSDLWLVSPPYAGEYDRGTLAAAWFAFEGSGRHNGALVIYPGSHKLAKKRLDLDFENNYGAYMNYLHEYCEASGCHAENYEAQAGDVLFWHGDFVHAGGPIEQQSPRPTRKSLVCHYAVIPDDRPSLTADWVRMRSFLGSYYVPSTSVVGSPSGA